MQKKQVCFCGVMQGHPCLLQTGLCKTWTLDSGLWTGPWTGLDWTGLESQNSFLCT